jgi:hypothetical protein
LRSDSTEFVSFPGTLPGLKGLRGQPAKIPGGRGGIGHAFEEIETVFKDAFYLPVLGIDYRVFPSAHLSLLGQPLFCPGYEII